MAAKKSTDVMIAGKVYTLSGYEEEGYLQRVASYINAKISEITEREEFRRIPSDMKAILVELNIADDYFKARTRFEDIEESYKKAEKDLFDLKHELVDTQMKVEELLEKLDNEQKEKTKKNAREEALEEQYKKLEDKYQLLLSNAKISDEKNRQFEEILRLSQQEKRELESRNKELRMNKEKLESALADALFGASQQPVYEKKAPEVDQPPIVELSEEEKQAIAELAKINDPLSVELLGQEESAPEKISENTKPARKAAPKTSRKKKQEPAQKASGGANAGGPQPMPRDAGHLQPLPLDNGQTEGGAGFSSADEDADKDSDEDIDANFGGNFNRNSDGNLDRDSEVDVNGNFDEDSDGNFDEDSDGDFDEDSDGDFEVDVNGNFDGNLDGDSEGNDAYGAQIEDTADIQSSQGERQKGTGFFELSEKEAQPEKQSDTKKAVKKTEGKAKETDDEKTSFIGVAGVLTEDVTEEELFVDPAEDEDDPQEMDSVFSEISDDDDPELREIAEQIAEMNRQEKAEKKKKKKQEL